MVDEAVFVDSEVTAVDVVGSFVVLGVVDEDVVVVFRCCTL